MIDPGRTLTEADIEAIVTQLRAELTRQFYNDLGRGVWSAVKTLLIAVALVLAAWGAKIEVTNVTGGPK